MAKLKTQQQVKRQKVQEPSDSEDEYADMSGDDVMPGSSSSDDVMDDEEGGPMAPTAPRQYAGTDIAALAAAAQQQAAAYTARQKKKQLAAAAAAGAVVDAGDSEEEGEEGEDFSEDMSDGEGGSSDEEAAAAGEGKRPTIYNAEGLHEKLEDISWIDEQPWRESLVVSGATPTVVEDVDDDLERELAFYNQAMAATTEAISRFESEGVSWHRPPDYYAEMVKSDEQMARMKDRLMYEQQQIDQSAERRKAREQKAYAKQVQAEKVKERAQEKKRQITQVQQLRKQREKSGFAGELDFDAEMNKGGRGGQQQQQRGQQGKPFQKPGQRFNPSENLPNKKRQLKDAKFGFGGKKRLQKQNDAFSAADMSGYKPGRFDDGGRGGGSFGGKGRGPGGPKGGVKKGGAANRPGKARRQQQKQRM